MEVAPRVGAWIETQRVSLSKVGSASLPAWERGLKHICHEAETSNYEVAPRVGAWIETYR